MDNAESENFISESPVDDGVYIKCTLLVSFIFKKIKYSTVEKCTALSIYCGFSAVLPV